MTLPSRQNRLVNAKLVVWLTVGMCLLSMPQLVQTNERVFGRDDCRADAPCGDDQGLKINSVDEKLQLDSDLQVAGHPLAINDMLLLIDVADPGMAEFIGSWRIRTVIDSKALVSKGIALDRIVIRRFYGLGVCRRSALRLVLAEASLGYAVIGDGIVLTTKEIADSYGNSVSERPTISGLTHDDVMVRRNTAFAAGNCRLDANVFLAPLVSGLKDTDRDVRLNSAYAIAAFGSDAEGAVGDLVAILASDDFTMREVAKYTLSRIGQPAIAPLLAAAENSDEDISDFAACALGDMGITGRAATEGLIGVVSRHIAAELDLHEGHCRRCRTIAMAVAQISTIEDRSSIPQLLKSKASGERAFASYVIGELGSSGMSSEQISKENVEHELEALLVDKTVAVRRAAAWALANLDLQSETAMQSLDAASRDTDRDVMLWATEALRKLRSKERQ